MTDYFIECESVESGKNEINKDIIMEIENSIPDFKFTNKDNIYKVFEDIEINTGRKIVIIIDEWDCILRERKGDANMQIDYTEFLRNLIREKSYIALAYMTGILPIKKYGSSSFLNIFKEYSMTSPGQFAEYVGFTDEEVKGLCGKLGKNEEQYNEYKKWYNGYKLINSNTKKVIEIYTPYSITCAIEHNSIDKYWNKTETFELLKDYINSNFKFLKENIWKLMNNERIKINIEQYQNDIVSFKSKDDILTLLIHLGYLGYDSKTKEVFIPNKEIKNEFNNATTRDSGWTKLFDKLKKSKSLLDATLNCDEETVAKIIEEAHNEANKKNYNDESALSYAIQLAYYYASLEYTIIPEVDSGKGYADVIFIPHQPNKAALVVELKYNQSKETGIQQIKNRNYPQRLEHYKNNILLVSINYDKDKKSNSKEFKHHTCRIEKYKDKE